MASRFRDLDLAEGTEPSGASKADMLRDCGIAQVFVLGLDRESQRARRTLGFLQAHGIRFVTWVQGFDGAYECDAAREALPELPIRDPHELASDEATLYFEELGMPESGPPTPGQQGCAMSHALIWKNIARGSPDTTCLVLEDDAIPHTDFAQLFRDAWAQRPRDGRVFNFIMNEASQRLRGVHCESLEGGQWLPFCAEGCVCYALTPAGAAELLGAFGAFKYMAIADSELWIRPTAGRYTYALQSQPSDFPVHALRYCPGIVTAEIAGGELSSIRDVNGSMGVTPLHQVLRHPRSGRILAVLCCALCALALLVFFAGRVRSRRG